MTGALAHLPCSKHRFHCRPDSNCAIGRYSHIRLADVMPSITQGLEAAAPLRDGEDGVALLHIGCGNSSWSAELAAQGVQV